MKTIFDLKRLSFTFFLLSVLSCSRTSPHKISFYYWKQTFLLSSEQQNLLNSCQSDRLYVKFFDVVLDEYQKPVPVAKIDFQQDFKLEVVPCVFIQNQVFEPNEDTKNLAKKMAKLLKDMLFNNRLNSKEIQIDCDWTKSTKTQYFSFLNNLQSLLDEFNVTCTIRLHQIKFQNDTGIPPVTKGLLMCYNMDDIENITTNNSIISNDVFNQYVNKKTSYPIKLDLALPIYQWALLFRLGKLNSIANDVSLEELKNDDFEKIGSNTFKAKKNIFLNQTNVCQGDLIRHEQSSIGVLLKLAHRLQSSRLSFERIIFYHLSQSNLNDYDATQLKKISSAVP